MRAKVTSNADPQVERRRVIQHRARVGLMIAALLAAAMLQSRFRSLTVTNWYHYEMCSHNDDLKTFLEHEQILENRALQGDRQALGYFEAITEYTDGATAEVHGGNLADVLIVVGDRTFAHFAEKQSAQCKRALICTMPGDFTGGSAHFDWSRYPLTHATLAPFACKAP